MGEGRNERSSKRQRSSYTIDRSASDGELAENNHRGRKIKAKERWPFCEGLTVDELARYRRRRVEGQPKDTLGILFDREGSNLTSEYRRAFRASSDDLPKVDLSTLSNQKSVEVPESKRLTDFLDPEGSTEDIESSEPQDFKGHDNIDLPVRNKGPPASLALVDPEERMETTTESSRFVAHLNPPPRPSLIRRGTSLKRDGDFYTDTETYSAYIAYEGQHRAELARRPTSLRMEGELETTTEKCEKFIHWLNVSRPELRRLPTNLKLEGELETSTENHDKYVPFVGARRPELLRRSTNLRLEGEASFVPEYADVFRKHNVTERSVPVRPEGHLRTGRNFFETTEIKENFVDLRAKEMQLMAKLDKDIEEEEQRRKQEAEVLERKEDEMKMLVSKLEDLKGPPMEVPEYKDAYKDFPRERPRIVKPEDEIGRADGTKVTSSPTHIKFPTKIDQDPEYKSRYLEYSRDRPLFRKPPLSLRPTVVSSRRSSASVVKPIYQEQTSEVRAQYIPYGHVPRVEIVKMPANLRLEGNLDLEPEYKTAYCSKRDYQACNEPRMHRRRERSPSASRRKENYWLNSNNAEQFGTVNAAQDQDAFQVLSTKVHEDNVIGKPPTGSRRSSRASQIQMPKSTQTEVVERGSVKNRSPSPTYRLHVCNVDDEPRGFARRGRSPLLQSSGKIRNPSPDRVNQHDHIRPYSPSFGRDINKPHVDGHSFVVLDKSIHDSNKTETRRSRRVDRNYNVDNALPASRGRPKTPTNWMPPWYDSTNTL